MQTNQQAYIFYNQFPSSHLLLLVYDDSSISKTNLESLVIIKTFPISYSLGDVSETARIFEWISLFLTQFVLDKKCSIAFRLLNYSTIFIDSFFSAYSKKNKLESLSC